MKAGWHWSASEVALLEDYIDRRRGVSDGDTVGWGSGRSAIQEIANRIGRNYFAVYRKMRRLDQGKLRRPSSKKLNISIRLTDDLLSEIGERSTALGMGRAEYIRHLVRRDLVAVKCSDAMRKAKG